METGWTRDGGDQGWGETGDGPGMGETGEEERPGMGETGDMGDQGGETGDGEKHLSYPCGPVSPTYDIVTFKGIRNCNNQFIYFIYSRTLFIHPLWF